MRDIGDEAPRISRASRLKSYFAGSTEITDRSLEVLAGLSTLESIELEHTVHVTNSGIAALALLPNLQQVSIGGLPLVTRDGASIFPPRVRVDYLAMGWNRCRPRPVHRLEPPLD